MVNKEIFKKKKEVTKDYSRANIAAEPVKVHKEEKKERQQAKPRTSKSSPKFSKQMFLEPGSDLVNGRNLRVHKEMHALVKILALEEDCEMYSVVGEGVRMYLESLPKAEQNAIWKKLEAQIELGLLKL